MKKSKFWGRIIFLSILVLIVPYSYADENSLRQLIRKKLGANTEIQAIKKTPYGGHYEVYMNDRIHYTDENFTYMIIGALIDVDKNINYSDNSLRKIKAIPLKSLPDKKYALLVQKGLASTNSKNSVPKQVLYVFSDPLCGHCKEFEKVLAEIPEIDIYVYLMPNDTVNRGSGKMAKALWCAPNPSEAYINYMRKGIVPDESSRLGCELPIKEIYTASERIGINATPAMVFEDGYPYVGKLDETRLRSLLRNTFLK